MRRGAARVVLALVLAAAWSGGRSEPVVAGECAGSTSAADLDAFFGGDDAAGLSGADYPHAFDLGDGRYLWIFQDAFFGADDVLVGDRFAHNAAMLQDGTCFRLLDPPGGDGTSWIGSWIEQGLVDWLWPLDAEIGADGDLYVFLAEVNNSAGDGAAKGALPVGTWRARISLPELRLVGMELAADPSNELFGYSIVSDARWTYLYGHCYRQFATYATTGFDADCSPYAYLARVPKGRMDDEPEYWSAEGWTGERSRMVPVFTADLSMPVSVERFGDVYVAVSDEDDWFGDDLVVRTAPAPQGPWTEVARVSPDTACGPPCTNYGAFLLPWLEGDQLLIAHSNNAWNMADALADGDLYRIDVHSVDAPGVSAALLARAAPLGDPPTTTTTTTPTSTTAAPQRSTGDTVSEVAAAEAISDVVPGADGGGDGPTVDVAGVLTAAALAAVLAVTVTVGTMSFAAAVRRSSERRRAFTRHPVGRVREHR